MDSKDPRDPDYPESRWLVVGPRAFVSVLLLVGFSYAGFQVRPVVGWVVVALAVGWVAVSVVLAVRASDHRWYAFWERLGRPFHSA
ncbi:hypothetical protein V5P93_006213 [Actinokineospora auranticolor]|uniref:Uncharacterized protein n=1 Tax=Actinokineospora auranticolor TaxID=155976 RepID=A0A2S6GHY6_9PSEU|nr:hypothetical protein [Actinokineospora auranticolor]PPK64810.1 hypothetical protein CLV40_11749 [Actinokineospora auranticolor]